MGAQRAPSPTRREGEGEGEGEGWRRSWRRPHVADVAEIADIAEVADVAEVADDELEHERVWRRRGQP